MDEQTYLTDRVDDQMSWYDSKSTWNQKRYKRLRFVATGLSLLIPFATGFLTDNRDWLKWSIGAAGIGIAIIEYLLSMNNYHCLLYTSPSPRDRTRSRMPSSA